jgi:hypothetical protein
MDLLKASIHTPRHADQREHSIAKTFFSQDRAIILRIPSA